MPQFTTRVELHHANTEHDYAVLHAAMERAGFSRTIVDDSGERYRLPTAEYDFRGPGTRQQVLSLAKTAAATTKKKFAVLVTESAGRTWDHLDRA